MKDQLAQLDTQLEEDAMQKDDLEIDLHALAMKLETILPDYKTLQFQVEELTERLRNSNKSYNSNNKNVRFYDVIVRRQLNKLSA